MSPPSSAAAFPFPFASTREPVAIGGICFVALQVADLSEASQFYGDVLGLVEETGWELPRFSEHAVLRSRSGQLLVLALPDGTPQPPDLGRHVAFGVTAEERDTIVERLLGAGAVVERYEEDRTVERADNFYFRDPDGNRIQLVVSDRPGSIDHAGMQAVDIEWEEDLYVGLLGMVVDEVVGWRTADYKRALRWGEGLESMAPGTRRWDKRFALRPGQGPMVPRANMQLFVRAGTETLAIFLAYERYPLPPDYQLVGVPRLGLRVPADALGALAERFAEAKLPTVGPYEHPAASPYRESLLAKDRGGNFLEFCVAR